jgi:biotin transport system permease protein
MQAAVFIPGAAAPVVVPVPLVLCSLLAGIRPWELLRGIRGLAVMFVPIVLFRSLRFAGSFSLDYAGAAAALLFCWRMILSFSAGALLFSVTTMTELRESAGKIETALLRPAAFLLKKLPGQRPRRLAVRLLRPRLSAGLALTLGFLPRFFEAWEAANLAWRARAGKRGIRAMFVLVPLVTERMIAMAADTAAAMEARGLEV